MRVLFYHQVSQSLGLEYLASALAQDGHEVGLVFDPGLANHPYGDLKWLSALGPSPEDVLSRVRAFRPDLIGLSILTNLYPSLREFARRVKDEARIPIVAGGPHATLLPEVVLADGLVDYVCEGEGEDVVRDLARAIEGGTSPGAVAGLWFRHGDGTIGKGPPRPLRQDIDALAFPERELFRREGVAEWALSCSTLRGCPFRCGYCTNAAMMERFEGRGRWLRRRSVENVVAELEECRGRYRPKLVSFVDELFSLDPTWIEGFGPLYRERVGIPFYCTGYPPLLTDRTVDGLVRAGCSQLCMGIEAGNDDIRRLARGATIDRGTIVEAARRVRSTGIYLYATCMFGLPGEVPEQMWETVDLVAESAPNAVKSFAFYPLPGTPLLASSVAAGLLTREDVRAIEQGRGSYHMRSPLRHPHAPLAFALSRALPAYLGAPPWARRWLRAAMRREWTWLARVLHLVAYPFFVDSTHVRDFLMALRAAMRAKLRARIGASRAGSRAARAAPPRGPPYALT